MSIYLPRSCYLPHNAPWASTGWVCNGSGIGVPCPYQHTGTPVLDSDYHLVTTSIHPPAQRVEPGATAWAEMKPRAPCKAQCANKIRHVVANVVVLVGHKLSGQLACFVMGSWYGAACCFTRTRHVDTWRLRVLSLHLTAEAAAVAAGLTYL
jgi:hypothetical protein